MRFILILLVFSVQAFGNVEATLARAARLAGVSPQLLKAVCFVESSLRPNLAPRIDGDTVSYGICQVKLGTASHMDTVYRHRIKASAKRLGNAFVNAFYAAKYLRYQLNRYNGDWQRAVDAYNKGHAVSKRSEYVRRVMLALNK